MSSQQQQQQHQHQKQQPTSERLLLKRARQRSSRNIRVESGAGVVEYKRSGEKYATSLVGHCVAAGDTSSSRRKSEQLAEFIWEPPERASVVGVRQMKSLRVGCKTGRRKMMEANTSCEDVHLASQVNTEAPTGRLAKEQCHGRGRELWAPRAGNSRLLLAMLCLIQLTNLQQCQPKRHPSQTHHQQWNLMPLHHSTHHSHLLKRSSEQQQVEQQEEATIHKRLQRDLGAADIQVTTPVTAAPTCGYPGSPAHASVTFNTSQVVVGTAASYTCDNGYELLGPPRRLCQANGTWSPIGIPFCVLNVGLGKAAMQSSTAGHGSAQKAVDGLSSPYFQSSTCTMTDVESSPWWYVNLLEPYLVQIVRIDFGTACCGSNQKATIAVRVGNNRPDLGNNPLCNRYHGYIEEGKPLFLPCTRPAPGAFVSIHLEAPSGSALSICETFIYTDHALSIEQCPSFRGQPLGSTATYNGKCYLFHNNQALSFDSARRYCESRGGSLVDETSPALQGFLSWELYRRHRNDQLLGQYWLGAQKDQRNGQNWKWINGKDVQISFWSSVPSAQNNCSRFDGSKGWLWSDTDCSANLNFICQYRPLSCGKPERPTNSTLINRNSDDSGNVIEYQCAPGNFLVGPRSRTCLPTGFFSDFAPKCKYLDCKFPAMIANGDYRLLNDSTSYQSVVNYFCNDGYQLYGKATLTCDVDERWNGPPPRCEPFLCPVPIPPSNGYVKVTSNITIPGTQATYDCRSGYELSGDRILTCTTTGSWDYGFPYCRERRQHMALPATIGQASRQRPVAARPPSSGMVQFPNVLLSGPDAHSPLFGTHLVKHGSSESSTSAPSSSTTSSTTTSTTMTSSSTAKASALSTQAPTSSTAPPPPFASTASSQPASLNGLAGQSFGQQPAPVVINPSSSITSLDSNTIELRPSVSQHQQSSQRRPSIQTLPANPFIVAPPPLSELTPSQPQLTGAGSQMTPGSENELLLPVGVTQPIPTSSTQQPPRPSRPSSPSSHNGGAAASNIQSSFTVHQPPPARATHQSLGEQSLGMMSSSNTQTSSIYAPEAPSTSAGRVHGNYGAGARYSLDGIIASAIFGGFLFLGTIITIIVIIIRSRKKSNRSSIDAQTISTFDSNGEHSGLYRNYQQAWENLRFASPNSQPKSSGPGPGPGLSLAAASMPATSLRNFASSGHHVHLLGGAHHNPALLGSSGSGSSASSQSSTLGGVSVAPTNGSAHMGHRSHPHAHHTHHHESNAKQVVLNRREEDEDEEDEREIMSSDEFAYQQQARHQHLHHHHHHNHRAGQPPVSLPGEEFRDSDELTINADTAMGPGASATSGPGNIGTGTIGRAGQRYSVASAGSLSRRTGANHQLNESNSRSQQQVASSTPSNSSRSSRASQPSDEHLLDRLAYSNNWRPKMSNQNQDSARGSNHSAAGSSASILGRNGTRYN